ncbi:MAG: hypothetical protein ACOH2J_04770 [Allorhizobium sp.]
MPLTVPQTIYYSLTATGSIVAFVITVASFIFLGILNVSYVSNRTIARFYQLIDWR